VISLAVRDRIKYTLRLRLFLFLIILVITILSGILIILFVSGNITAGLKKSEEFILNEHAKIVKNTDGLYDNLAAEAVSFSRTLSLRIESFMREEDLKISDFNDNPALLNELLSGQLHQIILYLQKSKSSGAFIILDATSNTRLPGSEYSKAGVHLTNMEPNIISSSSPTIYVLRGNADLAYKNFLPLHPQWRMEFNTADAPYFSLPMDKARENTSLSNLYYWSEAFTFPKTNDRIMICSVPLIDSEGNVFGVCGFDVSYMLFKLLNTPDTTMYNRIFCLLSPVEDNMLKVVHSLFSGGYSTRSFIDDRDLHFSAGKKSLFTYENNEHTFIGYHELLKLYPENSAFADNEWALALMVPQEDINSYVVKTNLKFIYLSSLIMVLGIIVSFVLSKFYIMPISRGIEIIKNNPKNIRKTNIAEIDELIEFLSDRPESETTDPNSIILNEFLNNIKTLTPAERSVFNLYAQQYTAKEIAESLYLSINTIKTHTKHLYSKLNITSKEELILYVEMLKESGKDISKVLNKQ
jgi:DNA-binding CsgD family transcriptional regulator